MQKKNHTLSDNEVQYYRIIGYCIVSYQTHVQEVSFFSIEAQDALFLDFQQTSRIHSTKKI